MHRCRVFHRTIKVFPQRVTAKGSRLNLFPSEFSVTPFIEKRLTKGSQPAQKGFYLEHVLIGVPTESLRVSSRRRTEETFSVLDFLVLLHYSKGS